MRGHALSFTPGITTGLFPGKAYNEIRAGDTFATSLTVTETHRVLAAGLFGDFNPLHVNERAPLIKGFSTPAFFCALLPEA